MNYPLVIATLIALYLMVLMPYAAADEINLSPESVITELENRLSTDQQTHGTTARPAAAEQETEHETKHWGYSGATDPSHWSELSEDYYLCEFGREQSPIDLNANLPADPEPIRFNYATVPFEVVNNGHSIQVNYPQGSTMAIGDQTYTLRQFHFHSPSEHTFNGKTHPMALHLVHANDAGEFAVVGVMIEPGAANEDVRKIWRNIPPEGASKQSGLVIYAGNLLPKNKSYVHYSGSLTTPPCSEGVNWIVMQEPITLSAEQIETFQALYPMNARPVQPANGRLKQ